MNDLEGLPLFAGLLYPEPAQPKCPSEAVPRPVPAPDPAPRLARAADAAPRPLPKARMIPFPLCRRVDLIEDLANEFMALRPQHGRRSRTILIEKRFKPLRARMKRLGVPADVIRQELTCLEREVARLVWLHDGGDQSGSGGGTAA